MVSPLLFILFYKIFTCEQLQDMKIRLRKAQFSENDMQAFFLYAAAVVTGCGNYRRIFREKIVPGLAQERFVGIIKCTKAYLSDSLTIDYLLKNAVEDVYKVVLRRSLIGSSNMFLSKNVTEEDIRCVIKYLADHNQQLINKRIVKTVKGNHIYYDIQIDSVIKEFDKSVTFPEQTILDGKFERTFKVTRGYCSGLLALINKYLDQALQYADYNSQRYCLKNIMNYFTTGNRHFQTRTIIKTRKTNPPIEIYLGFVKHWTDHNMIVGELGTVVMLENRVKKHYDKKLEINYEKYAKYLPWHSEFKTRIIREKDLKYVDVIHYASCSKNPKIIIPHDEKLRRKFGIKNIILSNYMDSLANVQSKDSIPFLTEEQSALYKQYYTDANSIFLDLYNLMGVRTAKMLRVSEAGFFNFQRNLKNPVTGKPIEKYYGIDETFKSKFGEHARTLEAFRAEGIALYCSLNKDIFIDLDILEEASDLTFVIWLSKVYEGLIQSLHDYNFETNSWQYVDMLPMYMMARYLLEECGESLISLTEDQPNELQDKGTLKLSLDRENIYTIGKSALQKLILQLTLIISTGDVQEYLKLMRKWSTVPDKGIYPLQMWYMDYIYATYKDCHKIAITPNPILKMRKYSYVNEQQAESHTEKKLEESELDIKQNDSKSKHKTTFVTERSVTELNLNQNLLSIDAILYDDITDDESDDEFAPKVQIPTDGVVILRKYEATAEGALTAFVDSYKDIPDIDSIMELTWVELRSTLKPEISFCINTIQDLIFEN